MANSSETRNVSTLIRKRLGFSPNIAVLGDENGVVSYPPDPGVIWARRMQAGGTYGKAFLVRGPTVPIPMIPGTPVLLEEDAQHRYKVIDVDFASIKTLGGNPTQSSVQDPNANNNLFVNQAYLTTGFGQIVEGTLQVGIRGWLVLDAGTWYKFEGQADFTGNVPTTGEHCAAVVAVLRDYSAVEIQYSTPKSTQVPLDIGDLQEAWDAMSDATNTPLQSFDIGDDISALVETNRWLDIRQLINLISTGGSGGGIALSAAGNTSGALALISTGTAILAGGNNITLSQNGQSLTISAFNQSQQTQNIIRDVSLSGNTSGALANISSGTLYLAGGNNITLSQSNNSVTISAFNQSAQTQSIIREVSLSGNTAGALADITSGTLYLAGGNNITLSQSNNSVTISAASQSQQTQNIIREVSLSGNTSGALADITSGTLYLAGGNNITLSQSNNSVTISAFNQSVQTQHLHDVTLSGNTSGTLTAISSGTLTLVGGNNITLSQSGNAVTISAAAQSQQTQNIIREVSLSGNTSGALADITSGTLYLAGGNNVTLSQSNNSVTISAASQSQQTQNIIREVSLSGNTSGALADITSGTLYLAGGNNVTLSQNGQSVTISGAAIVTLSSYEPYPMHNTGTGGRSFNSATSGPVLLYPFNVVAPVAARHMNMLISVNTLNASGLWSKTLNWGVYSRQRGASSSVLSMFTSASLSLALSGSGAGFATLSMTFPNTTNDTGYAYFQGNPGASSVLTGFNGLKVFQLLLLTTLTQGNYWLGLQEVGSTSVSNGNWPMSYIGAANTLTGLAPFGDVSGQYSTGAGMVSYIGQWPNANASFSSAGLTSLPNTINMNNLSAGNSLIPYMSFATTA